MGVECRRHHHLFKLKILIFLYFCVEAPLVLGEAGPPSLYKCCGAEEVYDFEKELCVKVEVELKEGVRTSSEVSGSDVGYLNDYSVTLPKRLVIDLRQEKSAEEKTEFRFTPQLPTSACSQGSFKVEVSLKEGIAETLENEVTDVVASQQINFTSKGQLVVGNDYYSTPEFCILGLRDQVLSIRVCNATCTGATPCIRKCCPLDQVWSVAKGGGRQHCAPAGSHVWTPTLYTTPKVRASEEELNAIHVHYKIVHPKRFCDPGEVPFALEERHEDGRYHWKFRVSTKGHPLRRMSRYTWNQEDDMPESYCLDGVINSSHLPPNETQTEYSGLEYDQVLFICLPPTETGNTRTQSILYIVLMSFSSIFLILTIAVYVALWDKQANHTWTLTLISYTASLFCFYAVIVTMNITHFYAEAGPDTAGDSFCYYVGVGVNFFLLSTFCWLSVINYDIICSVLKPTVGPAQGLRRYAAYAVFAWTVPITIVTVGLVLESLYRNDLESEVIIPEYGRRRCGLDAEYAQLVYAYGPAGALLIFNLVCFLVTVYKLYCRTGNNSQTKSGSLQIKQKQSLKLFAKLIFVMGVLWIFEFLSWYAEKDNEGGNSWYWVVFDVINIFQGIAIFCIFVCKPDVIYNLELKYPSFKRFLDVVMFDKESAEKITTRYPWLKRLVKPLTRRRPGSHAEDSENSNTSIEAEDRKNNKNEASVKMEKKLSTPVP